MKTRIAYYKDGVEVIRPKSLIFNGNTYVPPRDEILLQAGYEIREVEVPMPAYEDRVVELIRLRYSVNDELAILRQRDAKPQEFDDYNIYCEECKTQAKLEIESNEQ